MEAQENPATAATPVEPDHLLKEFRERSELLDARLDALAEMLRTIRLEIHDEGQRALARLAQAASDMANGRVYQRIDLEAKGELGALVQSLNTTLENLQQLDASVKEQTTQVPELAAQLDAITADTETATQSVMNRLDTLMAASDGAGRALDQAMTALKDQQAAQARFQGRIDEFLARASGGEDPTQVAQEVLEFLFEHQMTTQLPPVDLDPVQAQIRLIADESFEILNTLQFQDITRQKVEKVIQLLKQFQGGLRRLLEIFKIEAPTPGAEVFEHRSVATQERIFETSLVQDQKKESVDDIIAQFKRSQG